MSFTSGSISTRFSQRDSTSPNPVIPNLARGSRNPFLYASPNPGALQLKSTFDSPSYPNPRKNLARLFRVAVYVKHTPRTICLFIQQYFVSHRVRNQRTVPCAHRVRYRRKRRIEIGVRNAPSLAWTAVVTGPAPILRPRQIRRTRQRYCPPKFFLHPIANQRFLARQRHRRLKLSVRQMFQSFRHSRNANVVFHQVVIGLQVLVI